MRTVDQQLFDLVEDQEHFELTTEKGILISVSVDNCLEAECTLADTEDARLSISFRCGQKDFVQQLGITSVPEIHDLPPGRLIELYYEGSAELVCFVSIEFTYGMSFQQLGNRTIAMNERGVQHVVPKYEKLERPGQFMAYAKRYYELMECSEN